MSDTTPRPGAAPGGPSDGTARPWLTRASTIRGLWWTGSIVLVLVTLADLVVERHHPVVPVAGTFGFYSWYGLATCAAMVIVAKALGAVLKRKDSYYEP